MSHLDFLTSKLVKRYVDEIGGYTKKLYDHVDIGTFNDISARCDHVRKSVLEPMKTLIQISVNNEIYYDKKNFALELVLDYTEKLLNLHKTIMEKDAQLIEANN